MAAVSQPSLCISMAIRIWQALLLGCTCSALQPLCHTSSQRAVGRLYQSSDDTTSTNQQPHLISSNFWGSTYSSRAVEDTQLPAVPSLDPEGPLPVGAYLTHGSPAFDPKPTCRLAVELDFSPQVLATMEKEDFMESLQTYVEHGFQTFVIPTMNETIREWVRDVVVDPFLRETGSSVHWIESIAAPEESPRELRGILLSRLGRSRDALDTVILDYSPSSPYHLEVLDLLTDLQREGWVRSIGSRGWPDRLVAKARACGFRTDASVVEGNWMKPPQDGGGWWRDALAGGLLSDPSIVSARGRDHWTTSFMHWRSLHSDHPGDSDWTVYQKQLLKPLRQLAREYGVPVDCLMLRWTLQQPSVTSLWIPCDWKHTRRQCRSLLRPAFMFALEDATMMELDERSGRATEAIDPRTDEQIEEEAWFRNAMETKSGLFLP